jgi:hypothetical protein
MKISEEKIRYTKHIKAEKSVIVCKEFLEDHGYIVSNVKRAASNGHDLVAIKGSDAITIEVKTAFYSARSWKISKATTNSDLVAVVFPSGDIHFDSMFHHGKQCSKSGYRCVTQIAKIYQ